MQERRISPRMPVSLDVVLNYRSSAVVCTMRDVSLGGAFLEAQPAELPYNGAVEINMTVRSPHGQAKFLRVPAQIARITERGAGVTFGDLGQDAYFNLVDLVFIN